MKSVASHAPKKGANTPHHAEHNARGTAKNPFAKQGGKTELLARMKAVAKARKAAD